MEAKVTKILLDFETAAATSVKSVVPQIKLIFCLFHFTHDPSIMKEITQKWITGYSEEGSNLRMASERKFSINVRSRVKRLKYFFIYIGAQCHDITMNYYI